MSLTISGGGSYSDDMWIEYEFTCDKCGRTLNSDSFQNALELMLLHQWKWNKNKDKSYSHYCKKCHEKDNLT